MSANTVISTKEEFEEIISQEKVVIADFFATWCGPCRMISPIIEQLSEEFSEKVRVIKIDIDKENELANMYNIQSVPTVIIFKDGEIHSSEVGLRSINDYRNIINSIL